MNQARLLTRWYPLRVALSTTQTQQATSPRTSSPVATSKFVDILPSCPEMVTISMSL